MPSETGEQIWHGQVCRWRKSVCMRSLIPALAQLREMARSQPVTLVFAAHDTEHCNAAVLRDLLAQPA